jgi:hypothetical protein
MVLRMTGHGELEGRDGLQEIERNLLLALSQIRAMAADR